MSLQPQAGRFYIILMLYVMLYVQYVIQYGLVQEGAWCDSLIPSSTTVSDAQGAAVSGAVEINEITVLSCFIDVLVLLPICGGSVVVSPV